MNIGNKLRSIREYYGFSQSDLGRQLGVPPRNISNYETIEEPTGVLEYIFQFCSFFKMPVNEFFLEELEDLKQSLPDYITPEDAAVLKILNTAVDIKTRLEVKKIFVSAMKVALLQNADKIKHLPEFKALFGDIDSSESKK